ncbi:TonB-dependent receptor [Idiomarina xiamenensis 10-D-4]|uniref:TonB-dependent receptor n=2 Tax=Idiomarina xiamenensis TaxID=1207041 RepID=K2JWT4_9GAMM|nr:TonB-dependent receptor [Idiomarina xiamenensis 10-D-4]
MKYLARAIGYSLYSLPVFALASPLAQAQQVSDNAAEQSVERIEVTTSRRVETIQEVPAAVVAADPDDFLKRGMTSVTDVIEQAPGFYFSSVTGQQGRGSISARGVTQQDDSAVTAIYLDDVPLTSNNSFAAGGRLFFDGLLGDIERVELIKGPQGTLYGATAIAGAVRYITKAPELYEGRGQITADFSHTKNGDMNQMYRGFYSFPLIEDTLGLTLSAYSRDDGGYVDQVDPANGNVIRENANEADDHGYSADLLYKPTDKLSIRVKGLRQESSFGLSSAVRIANVDKEETYGEFKSDSAYGSDELTQTLWSASLRYSMDFADLDIVSSRAEYESNNQQDVVSLYGPLLEQVEGLDPGTITSAPLSLDVGSEKTSHEVRLTSVSSDQFEWLAGAFYTHEETQNNQNLVGMPGEILAVYAAFPSDYKEYAAFGNVTYYLRPDFDVTAGMRISRTEQSLVFIQDGVLLGGESVENLDTAKDTVETYLLTARYRPSSDTAFYARVASGYRPASANLTVYNPFTNEQLSQPVVEQDDLWSYEVGVKGSALDDKLSYETALYYIDWKNFQTNVTFFGVTTGGNADNGITVKGFENSLVYQFNRDLSWNLGLSYSDSTLNEDEPTLFGEKGAQVPNVPKWTVSSGLQYWYSVSDNVDGWLSLNARYKDETVSAFSNGDPSNPSVNVNSDAYTLVNLTAGFEWQDLSVSVYVNNLFDRQAYTRYNATAVSGTDVVDITAIPLQPRKIGVSFSYSF